ncbi:hypothetical protein PSAB_10755 [Paenibacillus sabinae T27]|uniref:Replication initiation factor family protein n=2 Tax=Paenibacillus sabinae TaxID=365617 RepID=X4ZBT0_9BACL|nr:hypothetical protein PSAB_10755 [Paenibacillus sabinae T27]
MRVSSDTKTLYIKLNDIESRQLFNSIIKAYNNTNHVRYRYFVLDKRKGVYLWHIPKFPTSKFTCKLMFHGYSDDSPLLRDIFSLIPLHRWSVKRLDIAFDSNTPYEQFHAVHPPKRADVRPLPTSMYMGSRRSSVQLHMYDKQLQMQERHRTHTDTWTRTELRFRFPTMKKVSALTIDDFISAQQYQIITDITAMPAKQQELVRQLNAGSLVWGHLTRANQKKIREYAAAQAVNLYNLILSNVDDLPSFIHSPSSDVSARTS